ncbi:hypothetical protein DFJ77DRAFT_546026 [Powellomyces hirtus]|nr:hypothetical protein DFJ77DRAFT_546026 [Powellomyces hirtus]
MGTVARLFNLGGGGGASGSGGSGGGGRKRSSQPPEEGHYLEGFAATQARMAEEELQATVALLRYLAKACPPRTLQRKGTAWYWWPMTDINHINTLAHQLESGVAAGWALVGNEARNYAGGERVRGICVRQELLGGDLKFHPVDRDHHAMWHMPRVPRTAEVDCSHGSRCPNAKARENPVWEREFLPPTIPTATCATRARMGEVLTRESMNPQADEIATEDEQDEQEEQEEEEDKDE